MSVSRVIFIILKVYNRYDGFVNIEKKICLKYNNNTVKKHKKNTYFWIILKKQNKTGSAGGK